MADYLKDATVTTPATLTEKYRRAVHLLTEAARLLNSAAVEVEPETASAIIGDLGDKVARVRDAVYSGAFQLLPESDKAAVRAEWDTWVR